LKNDGEYSKFDDWMGRRLPEEELHNQLFVEPPQRRQQLEKLER
jgi:hypothetical protein